MANHLARQFGHQFGCYDMLGFKVMDPSAQGVFILVALPDITTVSKHLTSAMRKLGVRTHAELMQTVSAKSA